MPAEPVRYLIVTERSLFTSSPPGVYIRLVDVLAYLTANGHQQAAAEIGQPFAEELARAD